MDTTFSVRSQTQITDDVTAALRVTGATPRWTDAEITRSLNQALWAWATKVRFPRIYTLTDGWSSDTTEYTLPVYVTPPLRPQMYRGVPGVDDPTSYDPAPELWSTFPAWDVDTGGTAPVLRLELGSFTLDGRVVYYATNGPVPLTLPTTSGSIDADDTSLTLTGTPEIGDVGDVLIGSEWMGYAGVSRGTATTTLTIDQRGKYSTTAASHDTGGTVTWGVCVDERAMYRQLQHQIMADLHAMFLTDGAEHERANHERLMSYYQQAADKQLDFYVGHPREVRMLLTRVGVGRF
jgi:hypothetical protein